MKKIKNIFLLILFFIPVVLQAQLWQWANGGGGNNSDQGVHICNDSAGNLYVGGSSQFPVSYFNTDTISINGFNDFFIIKYDANGNEIWIKHFGGPYYSLMNIKSEGIVSLVFDPVSSSLYASGHFIDSCNFGITTLFGTNSQLFLSKFDLNGNCLWATEVGNLGYGEGARLTTDTNGYIYIAGGISNPATFDSISLPRGGFLAKYDTNGNVIWAKNICNVDTQFGESKYRMHQIKYINNSLFIVGLISDSLTIDTITFNNLNYRSSILSCWDLTGNIKWAEQFGGPSQQNISSISTDNFGNIYCTGSFKGMYGVFGADSIQSTDSITGYIVKFDSTQSKIWTKQINVSQNFTCFNSFSCGDGTFYLTGYFSGLAEFGSYKVSSQTAEDIFVARYNSNGDCLGIRNTGSGWGYDVISDINGNAYLTGRFKNTINFDAFSLTSYGTMDMFIAKINQFTGIGELERSSNHTLKIYANPNAGKCNITIPDEFKNENKLLLSIYDIHGRIIQQKSLLINTTTINVDLEAFAKGIYSVNLSNGKKTYSGKIVLE